MESEDNIFYFGNGSPPTRIYYGYINDPLSFPLDDFPLDEKVDQDEN